MFKKYSLLFATIILFFGVMLPQDITKATSGTVTISTDTINIRSGPGLSYPLVKVAQRGDTFDIVKEKDDWIEIKMSMGKTGWVVNWLVTKDDEANPSTSKHADTTTTTETKDMQAKANTDQLRIRSGPGENFQIIGLLNLGQEVTIVGQNENWYKITSLSGDGWVLRDFLDIRTNKTSKSPESVNTGIVNGDTLNVREDPSADSSVIGKLTEGTIVTIYSKQGKWIEIGYGDLKGWASAEFIDSEKTDTKKSSSKKTASGLKGTVTASTLSVRTSSSLNSSIIGSVQQGQTFAILEESNNWAKIEYEPGSFGWIAGWYLDKSGGQAPSGQIVKDRVVTILHNGTNIREEANVESDVIELAKEGTTYPVQKVINDWYEVKLSNGQTGYVAGWIVSINGTKAQIEKSGAGGYLKNKTIVLDPGHGGGDSGTIGANGTLEKELTLRTAKLLYDKLTAAGANVYLTRTNDSFISLPSRVYTAESYHADAFISIHYDSNPDRSIRGMTGFYYHTYQKSLAKSVYNATVSHTKMKGRGVQIGDFHVIRENSQKATLIELGYLSNPEEEMKLNSSSFQENAASGLYEGLARYFKNN